MFRPSDGHSQGSLRGIKQWRILLELYVCGVNNIKFSNKIAEIILNIH